MQLPRDEDGKLSAYAWPGGYPILYLTCDGLTVCPKCANTVTSDPPRDAFVHWEGEPIACDDCGAPIESAYGPVEP